MLPPAKLGRLSTFGLVSGPPLFDEHSVLEVAQSDPTGVANRATDALRIETDARRRAVCLWARGVARRELDDLAGSEEDLNASIHLLDSEDELRERIVASLALVVLYRGDGPGAIALLTFADTLRPGAHRGNILLQRGLILHRVGDLAGARRDYAAAAGDIPVDNASSARALINLGVLDVQQGMPARAVDHLDAALGQAERGGHALLAAFAEHNLAYALAGMGAISEALGRYDSAIARYRDLHAGEVRVAVAEADRAQCLMSAHLLSEADEASTAALELLVASDHLVDAAESAVLAARVRVERGDLARAHEAIDFARQSLEAGGRDSWLPVVDALAVQIAAIEAGPSRRLARRAVEVASALDASLWTQEAQRMRLVAVRAFVDVGEGSEAERILDGLAQRRLDVSPIDRAARQYCVALVAAAAGRPGAARAAVTRGLDAFGAGRLAASSFEVRAHVLGHVAELATLGLRLAIERRDARGFVRCIERSRSMLLAGGAIAASSSDATAEAQVALRDLTRRSNDPGLGPSERGQVEARRRLLEREIARRAQSETAATATATDASRLFAATQAASILEYAEVDGRLWLAAIVRRRASLHELPQVDVVRDPIEHLRFAIARLQRERRSAASVEAAAAVVARSGADLRDLLIPAEAGRRIAAAGGRVVVVPARSLAAVPWACLLDDPSISLSVAGSGFSWLQASEAADADAASDARRSRRVVIAHGSDLDHAPVEAAAVASCYPSSMIVEPTRSADELLAALPSADVAHLACHGSFRSDNPLFSSLRLADGDLTFYDLRACGRMPSTVVLSACDVGRSTGLEGGAFLGLSTALLQLGVGSVIAPVTEVSDERSIAFMTALHTLLGAGIPPSTALAQVARDEEGRIRPIAAPFVCFGA